MKKIFIPIIIFSLLSTACSKREEALRPVGTVVKEFVASFRSNDGDTKTSLWSKGKVMWDDGDTIRYYSSANGMVNEYVVPENAATVTIPAKVAENDTWIIAAYGGKISEKHGGSSLVLENAVNAEQSGKFRDAHVSLAGTRFSTGNNLHFWNLTSLIRFAFNRNDVAYITLKSKDRTKLHGDGRIECIVNDTEIVTRFPEDAGGDSVKVNVGASGEYYISTLPCSIKGFTINLFNKDGFSLGYVESSKTLSLGDGKIVNLGELDGRVQHNRIKSVSLDKDTVYLMTRSSYDLTAVVDPSGALVKGYKWSSTNTSVVYVDSVGNGIVFAMGKGEANVKLEVTGIGVNGQDTTVVDNCHFIIHDFSEAIDLGGGKNANCYMINDFTPGMYKFDCACVGNRASRDMHPASVEVVWESFGTSEKINKGDLLYIIDMKEDSVAFATTGRDGNALIAAKDENGVILWSWHIWITEKPAEQLYFNKKKLLDRNLGALTTTPGDPRSLGLFYQWGRKDPFLGSSVINSYQRAENTLSSWPSPVDPSAQIMSGVPATTIAYTISHPTTFINGNQYGDWICVEEHLGSDAYLWRENQYKDKTIYDPCPSGYRVVMDTTWVNSFGQRGPFEHANYGRGMNFGTDVAVPGEPQLGNKDARIWYPAAGVYIGTTAMFVGTQGAWWSCNTYYDPSTLRRNYYHSSYMRLDDKKVYLNYGTAEGQRYNGYSVRCEVSPNSPK